MATNSKELSHLLLIFRCNRTSSPNNSGIDDCPRRVLMPPPPQPPPLPCFDKPRKPAASLWCTPSPLPLTSPASPSVHICQLLQTGQPAGAPYQLPHGV